MKAQSGAVNRNVGRKKVFSLKLLLTLINMNKVEEIFAESEVVYKVSVLQNYISRISDEKSKAMALRVKQLLEVEMLIKDKII